jgi:hypothetical protein
MAACLKMEANVAVVNVGLAPQACVVLMAAQMISATR